MNSISYRQDIMGRPGRRVYDMRPPVKRTGGGGSYSDFAFGFSTSGITVTVNAGYVFHGTRTPILAAETNITIAEDSTYIFVVYVFGSGAASVSSSLILPQHTATTINWLLYMARLTSGVVSISKPDIHWLGSIHITGAFA